MTSFATLLSILAALSTNTAVNQEYACQVLQQSYKAGEYDIKELSQVRQYPSNSELGAYYDEIIASTVLNQSIIESQMLNQGCNQ